METKLVWGIRAVGLALYVNKTLIMGDVHMGYEEALNKSGILAPRHQYWDTRVMLKWIFEKLKQGKLPVNRIIINGDLKHEFGTISETEWRNTIGVLDMLLKECRNVILIKGNHDTILGPIAKKRNVILKDYEVVGNMLVCHGDKIPKKSILDKAKVVIIGHEHPAVALRDRSRLEKYKCFLVGKWKTLDLIVMPSFNTAVEGADILREKQLSPFLKDILDFQVFVLGDRGNLVNFGTVSRLKEFQREF
ncbi:MAG: metallophosphoesterase [Nanoarchaeota archaeon]|nr:metallophosphoesterase [Nanoarchaeota archaeon]